MRLVALLLALACLLPAAARAGVPDEAHVDLRYCTVDWTNHVDNAFLAVRCALAGQEVLYYKAGSGFAGPWCESRVLGQDDPSLCLP